MSCEDKELGKLGEQYACDFLTAQGYRIVEKNFRYGMLGELDIIAEEGDTLVFVEVRTRRSEYVSPEETVTQKKQSKIIRLAEAYLDSRNIADKFARLDVISICIKESGPQIDHLINAFQKVRRL